MVMTMMNFVDELVVYYREDLLETMLGASTPLRVGVRPHPPKFGVPPPCCWGDPPRVR